MPCCLIALVALLGPRFAIVLLYLTNSQVFSQVFDTWVWPLLGFMFMPWTTLAFIGAMLSGGVQGLWLVVVIICALADLGVTAKAKVRVETGS